MSVYSYQVSLCNDGVRSLFVLTQCTKNCMFTTNLHVQQKYEAPSLSVLGSMLCLLICSSLTPFTHPLSQYYFNLRYILILTVCGYNKKWMTILSNCILFAPPLGRRPDSGRAIKRGNPKKGH